MASRFEVGKRGGAVLLLPSPSVGHRRSFDRVDLDVRHDNLGSGRVGRVGEGWGATRWGVGAWRTLPATYPVEGG